MRELISQQEKRGVFLVSPRDGEVNQEREEEEAASRGNLTRTFNINATHGNSGFVCA